MFPWESSLTGSEHTPVWALSGPLEHHISGCVAFAAWNYYRATQDLDWLRAKGFPIIDAIAEFWESRVDPTPDAEGYYHIRNVVAADEWAENVDDDAFTNGVAKVSLEIAEKAARLLGKSVKPGRSSLASKIIILRDKASNVTMEHATYHGEPIKQADVNLLAYPLEVVTDPAQVLRDLNYYLGKVPDSGTPAMTYSIFALLFEQLDQPSHAYDNFLASFVPNTLPPFSVLAECRGGTNPYFMTGAGGVLQSLVFGFGGYSITDKGIVKQERKLPPQWTRLEIKIATHATSKIASVTP